LRGFAETGDIVDGVAGVASSAPPKICFVFSGNGSQWAGMGRTAFARNHSFRQRFSATDEIFIRLAGWSLVDALHDHALADRLRLTRVAQPLLFAVHSALAATLAEWGLRPDMVLGHSVGEVAAAKVSGAIDLAEAVHVIFRRSEHQEKVHGLGRMAAASLSQHEAETFITGSGLFGLEIAAVNSPTSVTVSGSEDVIRSFGQLARKRRVAVRVLDLAYPFHSAILEPLRLPLLEALGHFAPRATDIPFISTVDGDVVEGGDLDAEYWWRNVREPVRFRDAVELSAQLGATLFVEIGPRPILTASITDTLRQAGLDGAVMPTLVEKEDEGAGDPIALVAARALTMGCRLDTERLFGARAAGRVKLPSYAWQRTPFSQTQTSEALEIYGTASRHPLIGARFVSGTLEWRNLIDPTVVPYLSDHRIGNEIIVPGSALAEMALAVAREIFPEGPIGLEDFDLLQWLPLRPDGMREISVRLSGETQVVEIWSRPRLSANEWTLHARGRIVQVVSAAPAFAPWQASAHRITAGEVYDIAASAGVQYGPAFRRLLRATRDDKVIEVELSAVEEGAGLASRKQILHPIALDASFHALWDRIRLRAAECYAYLPVRFARLRVDRDGAIPARARLVVDRETDHSITIGVTLYDENDNFTASLSGGLFREVVFDRRKQVGVFFHQEQIRLTRSGDGGIRREIALAALRANTLEVRPDSWLILEAFARSLAYRRLRTMFGEQPVLREVARSASHTMAAASRSLIISLFEHLLGVGLASETPEGWILADACDLPGPSELLETFAAEYSGATAEIVLAAQALSGLDSTLKSGVPLPLRNTTLEQFESTSILLEPVLSSARAVCSALAAQIRPDPLRVLVAEPSCLGLLRILTPLVHQGRATVTVIGSNADRLHHTAARRGSTQGIEFLDIAEDADRPGEASFDLALAFAFGPVFDDDTVLGQAISRRLTPNGLLCILEPPDDAIFDVLLGGSEGWFVSSLDPNYPLSRVGAARNSGPLLIRSGFSAIETLSVGDGAGNILLASADPRAAPSAFTVTPAVLVGDVSPLIVRLMHVLRADGRPVQMLEAVEPAEYALAWPMISASAASGEIFDLIFAAFTVDHGGLDRSIAHLAAILETVQMKKCRLWIVVRGLQSAESAAVDPIAEAIWCFARVAMNEYPSVDLKLVDVALDLDEDAAAQHVASLIFSPGADAELLVDAVGISAIRAVSGLRRGGIGVSVPAVRLELAAKGVLANFDWVETERRAPGPSEVEIEIAAAGVNFRDIMLATGLLADDVLDDGLAGAEFGFECAGKVVRVGEAVTDLKIGDAVMGFGRQSFATYTTADARVFAALPEGLPVEAAATIPVAFLTAWYSLVHLARLQPGEWVLIHGAAGGVGLAAMQIARLRGARIAATVSSPEKRALVELFGAEAVYNSRNTAFLDEIRDEIGGVDVVLNSLAGDPMLASIKCLKPFGRFVELGKRDYVLNTAMGLRPFRANLTYYGVDLDQLLAANLPLANQLMGELVLHFESGELCPLPYRAFAWHEASEAFQLMQAAGHVGKLIVRPGEHPIATTLAGKLFRPGLGVHLVVGGTGGFGFETAAWLAKKGAEAIVVASRRGQIEPHLLERAEAIRATGTRLIVEALDATNAAAVDALISKLVRTYGRLAGVIHTAMVLDDGLIAGLEPARTRAVLAPKVDGATNLDRATNLHCTAGVGPLDYFVVYSSATTMIGNPGQAAYVAANGYLQGLMRRRRADGLPGLAVAWGAISDVGVLAREPDVAVKLERITGIVPMRADEALSHLDKLLARPSICPPTVYCAMFRPGAAPHGLKLLETPAFARLFADAEGSDQEVGIDLAVQLAGKSEVQARAIVAKLVASEVARILRLSAEEIDVARPLDHLGMDSLMSLELRMSIEQRFGIELPIVAISSGSNVNDLAARLFAGLGTGGPAASARDAEMRLIMQHGSSDVAPSDLMAVTDAIDTRHDAVVLR
jgi:phthiocerol/phenolphthiocerol synthesis type-I polyketide synthase C